MDSLQDTVHVVNLLVTMVGRAAEVFHLPAEEAPPPQPMHNSGRSTAGGFGEQSARSGHASLRGSDCSASPRDANPCPTVCPSSPAEPAPSAGLVAWCSDGPPGTADAARDRLARVDAALDVATRLLPRFDEQKAELLCQRAVALGALAEAAAASRTTPHRRRRLSALCVFLQHASEIDALHPAVAALRSAAKQLAFVGAEGPAARAQEPSLA